MLRARGSSLLSMQRLLQIGAWATSGGSAMLAFRPYIVCHRGAVVGVHLTSLRVWRTPRVFATWRGIFPARWATSVTRAGAARMSAAARARARTALLADGGGTGCHVIVACPPPRARHHRRRHSFHAGRAHRRLRYAVPRRTLRVHRGASACAHHRAYVPAPRRRENR